MLLLLALMGGWGGWAFGAKPDFHPRKDAFSFNNDTVREYLPDETGEIVSRSREQKAGEFTHSCFLLCRATMQFAKFAEFAPDAPKVSAAEYRKRVRTIFHRSLWRSVPKQKTVIPGYANLWEFSGAQAHKAMLQANMGSWRLTYLRVGNYRMGFPFPGSGQALAARRLIKAIDKGELQAVYLSKFPKMNHCVVFYDYRGLPGGDIEFLMYDPNYCGEAGWVRYHAKERYFEIQERWFYKRGRVNLMRVYLSPFH